MKSRSRKSWDDSQARPCVAISRQAAGLSDPASGRATRPSGSTNRHPASPTMSRSNPMHHEPRVKCITDRDPGFLQEAYKEDDLDLIPHDGFVRHAENYIKWSRQGWSVYMMTIERVPRFVGRYPTCKRAIFYAR